MSGSINGGKYLGSGLGSFDLNVDKSAINGNQKSSDAINTSRSHKGAEIVSIDSDGNAMSHAASIKEGVFTKPKATSSGLIAVDNLSSSSAKVDKTKPLAIDASIASAFGAKVAILVDEKDKTAIIGQDKNTAAADFLNSPTAKKVDAAYTIAGDDNFVNKKMASNSINTLSANYRNTAQVSSNVNLLKDGQVKTGMNSLIGQLNTLSANTTELETQIKNRNSKYSTDIAKPQDRLNKANQAWDNANQAESGKVNQASENVREAQYPGVHQTENALSNAKQMVNDGKSYLQKASQDVASAQGQVNRLEDLKENARGLQTENRQLDVNNKQIQSNMMSYMVDRRSQLSSFASTLNSKAQYYESLAAQESRKQPAPQGDIHNDPMSGGGQPTGGGNNIHSDPMNGGSKPTGGSSVTNDPFGNKPTPSSGNNIHNDPMSGGSKPTNGSNVAKDPFASKSVPSSGSNIHNDPMSGGSKPSGGNDIHSDPMSGGSSNVSYRNEGLLNDYRTKASETRQDAMSMDIRAKGLSNAMEKARTYGIESPAFRNAVNSIDDDRQYNSYGYVFDQKDSKFFTDERSERALIKNNFIQPYDENSNRMNRNNQTINAAANEYKSNIDGANARLVDAKVNESQASGNLAGAQSSVTQYSADLQKINSSPAKPDSNPQVKSAKSALDKAQKHMDDTVGEKAPLTKEKNTSQGVVDQINSDYKNDSDSLNQKVNANSQAAQQKINETKKSLGI